MSFVLDESTAPQELSEGLYEVELDQRFWNMDNAFGGWIAAAIVSGWERHREKRGALVNQNVQFHTAVRGHKVRLSVGLVERRRTIDFWKVEVREPQSGSRVLAAATLVAGERTPTETRYDIEPEPMRPQAESFRLDANEMTPSWFGHYEIYLAKGRPFTRNPKPRSATWVRESDRRPLDAKALAAMVDTPMPRTFFVRDGRLFASTVSLSTHIYASDEELAAVGDGFVLLDTHCRAIRHSFLNAETYAYSDAGLLLAASYQTGIFREPKS
ncbi:MAG: acyl-CoA thioesterase domain-containing protein [Pseudomonadota bacterium]